MKDVKSYFEINESYVSKKSDWMSETWEGGAKVYLQTDLEYLSDKDALLL